MKITQHILSIPPHLSTTWEQVTSLYVKDNSLVVSLRDKSIITIPDLSPTDIEAIFQGHAAFIDSIPKSLHRLPPQQMLPPNSHVMLPGSPMGGEEIIPLRLNLDNMESLASSLRHTPSQSHLPDLPADMVNKIAAIAKIIAPEEVQGMPKAELGCNCPHCQILRAIRGDSKSSHLEIEKDEEEVVTPEDLTFHEWTIQQTGDKLYTVTNKLDLNEKYNVFLGEPVGCTCGTPGCAHILAVLKS